MFIIGSVEAAMRAAQNMARENIMRPHAAGIILTALAWILSGSAVHAQDAVPETPPELRDFRLDQPRPETQPQTEPTTQPTQQPAPPPAVRTVPETTPEPPIPTARNNQPTRRDVQPAAPADDDATASETTTNPSADETVLSQPAPISTEPLVDEGAAPVAKAEAAENSWNLNLVFGIAGAIALACLFAFLLRRRQSEEVEEGDLAATRKAEATLVEPAAAPPLTPPPASPPAKLPALAESQPANVSIIFIPEKATISFTNLTVQGQLQIANEGKALAKDMQLRAVLLSASSQQQLAIDTFFADPGQVAPNGLGEAKPGERLGLSLELTVPLSEMQTFPLGDQRLLVPILVASLSYAGDSGETSAARLACMIGREAQPPKPKMGPLRLDKGPRSFAPLGQRPVYA
jgi:hypothetical protein